MMRTNTQKGNGRAYYSRYIAHHTKRNTGILILGALFLAGLLMGTLMVRSASSETLETLQQVANVFLSSRQEQSLMQNFFSSAMSSLSFLAALFVCGFCAISQPVAVAIPLFRGLGIGLSAASLYARYGSSAIGFVALLIVPGTLLSTLAILICCRESLQLSSSFFLCMGGNSQDREFYPLRIYAARYVACTGLCLLSSFLEATLYFGFANSVVLR